MSSPLPRDLIAPSFDRDRPGPLPMSRRKAIACVAACAAGGALAMVPRDLQSAVAFPAPGPDDLISLDLAGWQRLIGGQFLIADNRGLRARIRLEQVSDGAINPARDRWRPAGVRTQPVLLLFSSERDLASGTCQLGRAGSPSASLYFQKTMRKGYNRRHVYEAVLN